MLLFEKPNSFNLALPTSDNFGVVAFLEACLPLISQNLENRLTQNRITNGKFTKLY